MKPKEIVFYVALIVGLIAGTLPLRMMNVHPLLTLLGGLAVGGGLAFLAEAIYVRTRPPPPPPPPPPPEE